MPALFFILKEEKIVATLFFATEIENMLCSGLFIFNSFSSVVFASSKTSLHPSKLLQEASMLLVWPVPSMHESTSKVSEKTFIALTSLSELPC